MTSISVQYSSLHRWEFYEEIPNFPWSLTYQSDIFYAQNVSTAPCYLPKSLEVVFKSLALFRPWHLWTHIAQHSLPENPTQPREPGRSTVWLGGPALDLPWTCRSSASASCYLAGNHAQLLRGESLLPWEFLCLLFSPLSAQWPWR